MKGVQRLFLRLGNSTRKRIALGRGRSLAFRVKALFMSKAGVRAFYDTLPETDGATLERTARRAQRLKRRLPQVLDRTWYARTHGLSPGANAAAHYIREGRARRLAPAPTLAAQDGTLSQAGAARLLQDGIEPGCPPGILLKPDDPVAIRPAAIPEAKRRELAVVTASFGGAVELLQTDPDWAGKADFFLFADRRFMRPEPWKQVHASYHSVEPAWKTAFLRTHLPTFFPCYTHVLWVGRDVLLTENPIRGLPAEGDLILDPAAPDGAEVMWLRPAAPCVARFCRAWWSEMLRSSDPGPEALARVFEATVDLDWRRLRAEDAPRVLRRADS